jgi:hypothetical protein
MAQTTTNIAPVGQSIKKWRGTVYGDGKTPGDAETDMISAAGVKYSDANWIVRVQYAGTSGDWHTHGFAVVC